MSERKTETAAWVSVLRAATGAPDLDEGAIQQRDAARAACWRRVCPDAFDAEGNILPGALGSVITRVAAAGYNPTTGARRDG
jgi:hypothetical protein